MTQPRFLREKQTGTGRPDIKPIAYRYKPQVYELARLQGFPERNYTATPTSDTYNLDQGQDEFYFVLSYKKMELVLFGFNHGKSASEVWEEIGLDSNSVERIYNEILTKCQTTRPLHLKPC
jgi:NAD+ synthase